MNKGLNGSFSQLPAPSVPRSLHNLSHSVTTSMSVGRLYPVNWEEVLPGDTFNVRETQVSRLTSTFFKPVMDNVYLDTYHFYVPYTQIYDKAKDIFAVANPSQYTAEEYAVMPSTFGNVVSGSLADYLGLPLGNIKNAEGWRVSLAPFRAFAHIYNNWFRNQNITDEVYLQKGDYNSEEINSRAWNSNNYMGMPPIVDRYKDYFSSALPSPQKGASVQVPITNLDGSSFYEGGVPVVTGADHTTSMTGQLGMKFVGNDISPSSGFKYSSLGIIGEVGRTTGTGFTTAMDSSVPVMGAFAPANLWANFEGLGANLNDLRFAEAYQHELELNAMYGSRYNEFLLSHFGIKSDDLEIGIPQYLGGSRTPLNITQVSQTTNGNLDAEGLSDSPLAQVAANSWTVGNSQFRKRFKYHGIVMTVCCLRYRHTYQQGIASKWHKLTKDDFYNPSFAYIGMQPIYRKELFVDNNTPDYEKSVFGYKPAWNEYRFSFNTVTGEARSNIDDTVDNSLDRWHFADVYDGAPSLDTNFIRETNAFFERTITVDTDKQDNFLLNFYFDILAKRPITKFSEPSLTVRRW